MGNRLRSLKVNFGTLLRERREALGFESQKKLADALNLDQGQISRWERGQFFPDEENLKELCRVLEVQPSYFARERTIDVNSDSIFKYVAGLERDNKKLQQQNRDLKNHPMLAAYEKLLFDSPEKARVVRLNLGLEQVNLSHSETKKIQKKK